MILTGSEILKQVNYGNIEIDPFNENQFSVNSYDLRLSNYLMCYNEDVLDVMRENKAHKLKIRKHGVMLKPGVLYLGSTIERTYSPLHVPMLEGKSSLARLGLQVHISAGFGDIGFNNHWTLEISCLKPTIIYPEMLIAQVYFVEPKGEIVGNYTQRPQSKYTLINGLPQASKYHKNYE